VYLNGGIPGYEDWDYASSNQKGWIMLADLELTWGARIVVPKVFGGMRIGIE
jgi:hypothetical protein